MQRTSLTEQFLIVPTKNRRLLSGDFVRNTEGANGGFRPRLDANVRHHHVNDIFVAHDLNNFMPVHILNRSTR
jgi:hypothetical protein